MIQCNFDYLMHKTIKFTGINDKNLVKIGKIIGYKSTEQLTQMLVLLPTGGIFWARMDMYFMDLHND